MHWRNPTRAASSVWPGLQMAPSWLGPAATGMSSLPMWWSSTGSGRTLWSPSPRGEPCRYNKTVGWDLWFFSQSKLYKVCIGSFEMEVRAQQIYETSMGVTQVACFCTKYFECTSVNYAKLHCTIYYYTQNTPKIDCGVIDTSHTQQSSCCWCNSLHKYLLAS